MKYLTALCWLVMILLLAAATIIEKYSGTDFVKQHIYGSFWFVLLWALIALMQIYHLIVGRLYQRLSALLFHLSFILILTGGLFTFCTAQSGTIYSKINQSVCCFDSEGLETSLPFTLQLRQLSVEYYPGTQSPVDYVSVWNLIGQNGSVTEETISMNKILSHRSYRFFLFRLDNDLQGCVLRVTHDPWGTAITYAGYFLLLFSIVFFVFTDKKFKVLYRQFSRSTLLILTFIMLAAVPVSASEVPKTFPKELASQMGSLYVYYNGRICPLQTLAHDFTVKLYGKPNYKKLSSEQVLCGWMFYYDDWHNEAMIKIKPDAAEQLGTKQTLVSLSDFYGRQNKYLLADAMSQIRARKFGGDYKAIVEADEKCNIINGLLSGGMLKIFPIDIVNDSVPIKWYSQVGVLPLQMQDAEMLFVRKVWTYIAELSENEQFDDISVALKQIKNYQNKNAAVVLPSNFQFATEQFYNHFFQLKALSLCTLFIGVFFMLYYCVLVRRQKSMKKLVLLSSKISVAIILFILTSILLMRWIISSHVPLSNGAETMLFLAWITLLIALLIQKKQFIINAPALVVSGLSMLVASISDANPQITLLKPILTSPLLSLHVVLIMLSYALLALIMLNGLMAVALHFFGKRSDIEIDNLQHISWFLLYPAVFCLAIGIIIGAMWANVSWGHYWTWDPKEVWALITLMIYSIALHNKLYKVFRKPIYFHIFCILAFSCVIITYFGVNYFLGGMHSYA